MSGRSKSLRALVALALLVPAGWAGEDIEREYLNHGTGHFSMHEGEGVARGGEDYGTYRFAYPKAMCTSPSSMRL